MSARTKIQWCDSTLNPWRGCDMVSLGCANCYIAQTAPFRTTGQKHGDPRVVSEAAFKEAHRLNRKPWVSESAPDGIVCADGIISRRREIFSLSLGDWLDPKVPLPWLARWLDTIRVCDSVRWLLLTKRPELFFNRMRQAVKNWVCEWLAGYPPQHIAIGASVENQAMADKRIPELLRIPAHRRFLSCEPLLGPIEFYNERTPDEKDPFWNGPDCKRPCVNWVIVGGESGSKARPCSVDWIRSVKDQCRAAGVPVFVKQLGKNVTMPHPTPRTSPQFGGNENEDWHMELRDHKGGDPAEWPEDLRVQERMVW